MQNHKRNGTRAFHRGEGPSAEEPIYIAQRQSCAAVTNNRNTLSVRHIFADAMTMPLVEKMKTVKKARCLSDDMRRMVANRSSVPTIAAAEGRRAASGVAPNSFMLAAWHQ